MFHPVGPQRASVYWRRRAALLGAAGVLVLLTAWVLRPGRSDKPLSSPAHATHRTSSSAPAAPTTSHPASTPRHSVSTTPTHSNSATSQFKQCAISNLRIAAVTGALSYHVGDQPVVMAQVTNAGPVDCMQDLADKQIELRIYNGESRVWGSHDCEIQPGTDSRILTVGQAVRVSITWSGLSSRPGCAGTRQRVGAGTYTLYARLAGHEGTAAQFSIS